MQLQLMLSMMIMVGGRPPPFIPPMDFEDGHGDGSKQKEGEGKIEE